MLFLVAVGLAIDCFSVALCIGSSPYPINLRAILRLSFHFGLFQGGMTFLGWMLGVTVAVYVEKIDHWIALLLLLWVGIKMIREGFEQVDGDEEGTCEDQTRGMSLVVLSIATSIDAFGVGLSFAFVGGNIISSSLLIGLLSLVLTIIGLTGGNRIGKLIGKRAEIFGGFVLILIGLRIVVTHTLG